MVTLSTSRVTLAPGKCGNIWEFDSCYGNFRKLNESLESVCEKILTGKTFFVNFTSGMTSVFRRIKV